MCGIFAYIGDDTHAVIKAIRGLKDLEYRGYDSWGIAVKTPRRIITKKGLGKISQINEKDFSAVTGNVAIGHTRWATHGAVCIQNTHPHFNTEKTIAVVHNGIIENYLELKEKLGPDIFRSQTDTEVIPHHIDMCMRRGLSFEDAFIKTCRALRGRFAIIAAHRDAPFLLAARNGSPLVVGKKEGEYFIASDIPAFLDYTNVINYMNDGEYMKVEPRKISFFDFRANRPIQKKDTVVSWEKSDATKGGFPHFMLKEIEEQKESLARTLGQDLKNMERAAQMITAADSVFLVACGTAAHMSMAAQYLFSNIANKNVFFAHASEFHRYSPLLHKQSLLIPVTQSGETADVLEIIDIAQKKKCKILSVINVRGSSVERASDCILPINAGPEIAVASTKAATSQLMTFAMLAYALRGQLSRAVRALTKDIEKIRGWLTEETFKKIKDIARSVASKDHLFVIGRGVNYPAALEGALKIKEVSYIHAEGIAAGELKHGTIALIEKGTPCIALFGNDEHARDILNSVAELKARGAFVIGIGPAKEEIFDRYIRVPDIGALSPVVNIIATQIIAYYLAVFRGLDPDKPRNLAKSVTVK